MRMQKDYWLRLMRAADQQIERLENHLNHVRGPDEDSEALRNELTQDLASAKDMRAYYKEKSEARNLMFPFIQ